TNSAPLSVKSRTHSRELGRDDGVLQATQAVDFEYDLVAEAKPLVFGDLRAVQLEKTARPARPGTNDVSGIQRNAVARTLEDLRERPVHILHISRGDLNAVDEGAHA